MLCSTALVAHAGAHLHATFVYQGITPFEFLSWARVRSFSLDKKQATQVRVAYLERSWPSCCSSGVALRSLDLLMGLAKTRLKVGKLPSRSGTTKDIMAACNNSTVTTAGGLYC